MSSTTTTVATTATAAKVGTKAPSGFRPGTLKGDERVEYTDLPTNAHRKAYVASRTSGADHQQALEEASMAVSEAPKATPKAAAKKTTPKATKPAKPAKPATPKAEAPKAKRYADGDLEHSVFGRDIVVLRKPGTVVKGTNVLEAAYAGEVVFFKVRSTKGTRRWPVLAPKSASRKAAETIRDLRAQGKSIKDIAEAASVSISTVRRSLTALAFTENLEATSASRKAAIAKSAIASTEDDQQKTADAQAAAKK